MKKIMVVDDMAIIREPIAKALECHGYEVISLAGGEEALAAIQSQKPDLILLDMVMPRCDGLAVLRALKCNARNASIPVIMLTASATKDGILEAAKLGVRDYVLKSDFKLASLIQRIEVRLSGGEPAAAGKPPDTAAPPADAGTQDGERRSAELLNDAAPLANRVQIRERLAKCGELKAMSPTLARLTEMMTSSACPIEKIAKAIQQDHAVAVKILKIANSVVFSHGEAVDSVVKAVQRIGTNQIRDVVMSLSVVDRFGAVDVSSRVSAPQFWEHSIACGLIAAELARGRGGKQARIDAAFTMGLLHDVGRMVLVEVLGGQYNEVLTLADELRLPLEAVESKLLTINHAEAMEIVLRTWRFPKEMIRPIGLHHLSASQLRRGAGNCFEDACTLALADRLAHALLLGSSGNDVLYATDEFAEALNLPKEVIAKIEREIPSQTEEIKFAMLARSNETPWPRRRDQVRGALPQSFQPLYFGKHPETDGFRVALDQLRSAGAESPANLAVIHAGSAEEFAAQLGELKKSETPGEPALPLIVLSADDKITPDSEPLGQREHRVIPTPVSVAIFTETVNDLLGAAPQSSDTDAERL